MTRYYLTPDGSTAHSTPALSDTYPYTRYPARPYADDEWGYICQDCRHNYFNRAMWYSVNGIYCPSCMDRMVSSFDPSATWFLQLLAAVDAGYYVQDAA